MINIADIKRVLLDKNIILSSKKFPGRVIFNPRAYDHYNTKSWEDIKESILKEYPEFEYYFEEFPDNRLLTFALSYNLEEYPRCPFCGKRRSFFPDLKIVSGDPMTRFGATCGSRECTNKLISITWSNKTEEELKQKEIKQKATLAERHGDPNYNNKEKSYKTREEKYGNPHYNNIEGTWSTKIEGYGDPYYSNPEKIKQTNFERNNGLWHQQTEEGKNKIAKTKEERYGDPFFTNHEKCKITKTERYGDPYYNNRKKGSKTIEEKYGVLNYSQTKEYHETAHKKYSYNDMHFDSSWEIAVYIWNVDHDILIERVPEGIPYEDELGNKHVYFPDFRIAGELVEIKGSQLMDEEGNLTYRIYTEKYTEEERLIKEAEVKAKNKCMKENNVKIISDKEIKMYLKYIDATYGKGYLKQFKVNKKKEEKLLE